MAETQETIIAEMRDLAANRDWHNHTGQSNRERVLYLADRLEAALKRERGDCAKMREALEAFMQLADDGVIQPRNVGEADEHCFCVLKKTARAALAAPSRNCDNLPNADRAELEYRAFCERMGIDSSIYGAMAWILADDTEKLEGGNNNADK